MSNSTLFFLSTVAGIFFSSFFYYSFKKIFHMPDIKALNYAVALISGISFIGVCITLIYMALHHLIYFNAFANVCFGIYLGLNFFETCEMLVKKTSKIVLPILLHHAVFITLIILINYDGHAHILMAIVWLQAITNTFYHMLVVTPYSSSYRNLLSHIYTLTFVLFRIIGATVFTILFFISYPSILNDSANLQLKIYMPAVLMASLIFNYYVGYLFVKQGFQIKYKGPETFISSPPSI